MNHQPNSLLEKVRLISEEAGRKILEIYETGEFGTTFKEDHSPLTAADKAAHELIQKGLCELEPSTPVLSEESREIPYQERKKWTRYWLVDPLDGTKEFIKRNGEFTVNIALVEEQRPVLGVLHAPALKITYTACSGEGAAKWVRGESAPIKTADYREGDLCVVASRSHAGPRLEAFLAELKPARLVSMGSALKICLVAEGTAHFYPRLGPTMEWDTAAAHCILNEAGGALLDLGGRELLYNKESLLNPYFFAVGAPPFPWQQFSRHFTSE